ncbi:MAG: hypothetical protein ABR978_00525 [Dehalococcoidia bacterium]
MDWRYAEAVPPDAYNKSALLSLPELSAKVGFSLVLPTYLPSGISPYFRDDVGQAAGTPGLEAQITLLPAEDSGAPSISFYERPANPDSPATDLCDPQDCASTQIGGIDVACRVIIPTPGATFNPPPPPTATPPETNPRLRCSWENSQLGFLTEFGWLLKEPIPGYVSPEMRAEAMKVVTSMIEDPYVLGPGS